MKRRDLDYIVITLLVGSSIYVFLTGLIADTMGLHHFGFHSQVGYLWMSLAVLHLMQTWVRVKAYARHRFRGVVREKSTPVEAAESGPSWRRRYFLLAVLAIATGIGFDQLLTPKETDEPAQQDLGIRYHRWSEPGYGEAISTLLNWGQQPSRYKTYPNVPRIDLPSPTSTLVNSANTTDGTAPSTTPALTTDFMTVVTQRRSRRTYNTRHVLPLANLSQLLHLAQGITAADRQFRTVPSSGALYPLEIYPIVHRVEGLEPGIYHHAIQDHQLEQVQLGDFRQSLVKAGLNQEFLGEANVCFVVSGIFQRTRWKYHERTYRYVLMEAGHLGQNLYLAATALGLGVCGVGAFLDTPLNQLLNLDGEQETALYLVTVGGL